MLMLPPAPADPLLAVDWDLVPVAERVLVAVSGGADSMALLLALVQGGRDVVVAHVNHRLRGAESEADEVFVAAHCIQYELPYVMERLQLRSSAGHVNEAAAREARYAALTRLAVAQGCTRVATGHTASDQLETVLLNWLRGAAVAGWRGMRAVRPLTGGVLLLRPLLRATREQARAACRQAGWPWREDSSNASPHYLRNRVRHELLPLIDAWSGEVPALERLAQQTSRACEVLAAEQDLLDAITQDQLTALTLRVTDALIALDGVRYRTLPVALQRRLLRAAVARLQGETRDLGLEAVESARLHIVAGGRRQVWQWRRGVNVEWTGAMAGNRIRVWVVSQSE